MFLYKNKGSFGRSETSSSNCCCKRFRICRNFLRRHSGLFSLILVQNKKIIIRFLASKMDTKWFQGFLWKTQSKARKTTVHFKENSINVTYGAKYLKRHSKYVYLMNCKYEVVSHGTHASFELPKFSINSRHFENMCVCLTSSRSCCSSTATAAAATWQSFNDVYEQKAAKTSAGFESHHQQSMALLYGETCQIFFDTGVYAKFYTVRLTLLLLAVEAFPSVFVAVVQEMREKSSIVEMSSTYNTLQKSLSACFVKKLGNGLRSAKNMRAILWGI